jgi:chitinase
MKKLAALIAGIVTLCPQCGTDEPPTSPSPPPTTMAPPAPTSAPTPAPTTPSTTPPTPPSTPGADPNSATWLMGFYPSYQRYEVTPADFPYTKTTHTMIGNVLPGSPTECCVPPPWEPDVVSFEQFLTDSVAGAHAAGVKAILMTGGAGGNPDRVWNVATATDASAAVFAESMVAYARRFGFDGIELDWEEEVDMPSVARLATVIRSLWPDAVITVAITPLPPDPAVDPGVYAGYVETAAQVDRMNSMTYIAIGNWGGWDGPWHQSALYETADRGLSSSHPSSIHRAVTFLLAAGVPASKLGIGVGMFGSAYGDANGDGNCPSQPTGGWGGEWGQWFGDASLPLRDIERLYRGTMTEMWDEAAQAPYLTAAAPGAGGEADGWLPKVCYITYENERSAAAKADYVTANGLGGVIVWTVPQDRREDGSYPVLDTLNAALPL